MKNTIYIAFIILLVGCQQPQHNTTEVMTPINSGIIKSCKMFSSDFVLLDPNDNGLLIQEFKFNRKGFVNELVRYGMNGEVIGRFDIFGENTPFPMPGKPQFTDTAICIVDIDNLGVVKSKESKAYNSKGFLIKVEFYKGDSNLLKKNTYKYNDAGYIIEDVYWDVDLDAPKQKMLYRYEYFEN